MISHRKRDGFTITETVIVMTLTVVVLGIVWMMFSISNKIISDVTIKSDLQREGQAIQEELSNIGMQSTGIKAFSKNNSENIQTIQINSYYEPRKLEDSSHTTLEAFYIIYDKENFKLYEYVCDVDKSINTSAVNRELLSNINYELLSSDVKSLKINDDDISNLNENTLKNMDSIELTITLSRNRNYNNQPITYSLKVTTAFRNKNISGT